MLCRAIGSRRLITRRRTARRWAPHTEPETEYRPREYMYCKRHHDERAATKTEAAMRVTEVCRRTADQNFKLSLNIIFLIVHHVILCLLNSRQFCDAFADEMSTSPLSHFAAPVRTKIMRKKDFPVVCTQHGLPTFDDASASCTPRACACGRSKAGGIECVQEAGRLGDAPCRFQSVDDYSKKGIKKTARDTVPW
ncbi:unnamed protein product [Ixodes persulcatus]